MQIHAKFGRAIMLRLPIVVACLCFVVGMIYAINHTWYMTGLFPARFRALSKEQRIVTLRRIGLRSTPMRVRDVLLSAYPNQPPEEHELAHLIGETAYIRDRQNAFTYCDSAFTFACFHGVILAAIKTHGYSEDVLQGLSDQCSLAGKNETAKVSCAHGIGHGIMWVRNYAYLDSLELCDKLFSDTKLRFFCWDGVSMENVVRRSDNAQELGTIPWKEHDIYYPCDAIPVQYQPACTREHVFLVRLAVFARSTEKSIGYCLHFEDQETRRECFGALGGALNQDEGSIPEWIVTECNKIPLGFAAQCIGVAAAHRAFAGETAVAQDLCATLSIEESRFACMQAVERVKGSLYMIQSL